MSLSDKKVLASAQHYRNVQAQVGTMLNGTVAENKKVFDDYPELIKDCYNGLIDYLESTTADASGASQIGAEAIAGLVGTDIQTLLEALKTLTDTKADSTTVSNTYETLSDADTLLKTVSYNANTGTFTFTTKGGTVTTIDTTIEEIPVTMKFFENPVGSGIYYLGIYDKDDQLISSVNVSALFNPITVEDTATIDLTQTTSAAGIKTIKADVKAHSIGSTQIDPVYEQTLEGLVDDAETAATNAGASETNAGNSATAAGLSATAAAGSATEASGYATAAGTSATNAGLSATSANGYATNASNSATTASGKATLAESWAVGGTGSRTGEDTNNAKYWCEQAGQIAGGPFVTSVNSITPTGGVSGPITVDADHISDTDTTKKFTSTAEKTAWNAKYDKPATGIPDTDIASAATWNAKADTSDIPTTLAELTEDTTHRVVTDSDKTTWNGKSSKSTVLTGTLLSTGWNNNTQTLSISGLATSGYAYTVSPESSDFMNYANSMIYASDITVENQITFTCSTTPTADIDILILKCEVA